jgi:hypothetical protein
MQGLHPAHAGSHAKIIKRFAALIGPSGCSADDDESRSENQRAERVSKIAAGIVGNRLTYRRVGEAAQA